MHPTTNTRRALAGLVALAGMIGGTAVAQQPGGGPAGPGAGPVEAKFEKNTGALIVPLGGSVRFAPPAGGGKKVIADTFVSNEDVVSARPDPNNPAALVLTGRLAGATRLTLTFDDKSRAIYDVIVQPDYELLRKVIRQTVPTATVDIVPGVGNVIILTGYVTRPEDSDTIVKIASSAVGGSANNVINSLQIGGAQHVLIDVTVAQVDRTELRQRGFSWASVGSSFGISSVLGGVATRGPTLAGDTGPALISGITANPGSANIVVGIVPAGFIGALQALRTEGVAKLLSEPKVITQTGRPAVLRVGGQQATLGPSSGINGPGVVLQDVGTTLQVLPIVFGNGKIYLEVAPVIRSVNNGRGVATAFGFTPGFNESSIQSSVLLESGQTYAIGGLLENQVQNQATKVPFLGDLPYIGAAFSFVEANERETELLILVTPRLVDALDCNQLPKRVPGKETRNPDDYELFIESLLEAPRGTRKIWDGKCYRPAYLCSETVGQFPCFGPNCPGGYMGLGGGCAGGACGTAAPAVGGVVVGNGLTGKAAEPTIPSPAPVQPAGGEQPQTPPAGDKP